MSNKRLTTGDIIYIKAKNCKLLKDPRVDAASLAVLQPNQTVRWIAKESNEFHRVSYGSLSGYIHFANLTRQPYNPGLSQNPYECRACGGSGHLTPAGIDPSRWGNNFLYPVCPHCKGEGRIIPTAVFASSGAGTKA